MRVKEFKAKEESITYEYGYAVSISPSVCLEGDLRGVDLSSKLTTDPLHYDYNPSTGIVKTRNKEYLDTGEYIVIYQRKGEDGVRNVQVKIKVEDTTPPEFIDPLEEIYINEGDSLPDLRNYYKVEDLQEVEIEYETKGVNTEKAGEYPVTLQAKDASGNTAEWVCKVIVQ